MSLLSPGATLSVSSLYDCALFPLVGHFVSLNKKAGEYNTMDLARGPIEMRDLLCFAN